MTPVMRELWGIRNTPSLPLLPGPLWPGVVAPDRVLSVLNRTVWHLKWMQTNDLYSIKWLEIELFDHLTVDKQITDF